MSRGHERCAQPVQGPRGALATALTPEKSSADAYRKASTELTRYARYGALFTLSVVGGLPGLVPWGCRTSHLFVGKCLCHKSTDCRQMSRHDIRHVYQVQVTNTGKCLDMS